ncbi:MAG: PAS domain S-box-containing protein [Arcticibacterium sp.]|jgi:PAS domain S-box-containing protein
MANSVHILLVEDDEDDFLIARSILGEIPNLNFKLDWLKTFDAAKETIATQRHHLYLFDYLLGRNSGLDLLKILKEKDEDLPAILLTGKGDSRIDKKAIELGAYDYLEKSTLNADDLGRSMRYALKHANTLAALRESEQKYRRVFERSKDIIFIANEDFNIVNVSETVADFTGYTPSEVYSMQSHEYFEDPLQIIKMQDLMVKDGSIKDFQIHLKAKNGEVKTGLVSCVLERKEADKFFLHGIFSDQTEKIKAERALTQSRKLESTARLMQVLAHEVRNPLMNINLALDSLSDKAKEEDEEVLEIIQRNAKRIDTLINEVLHAASEKAIERSPTDLGDVIELALAKVRDRAQMQQVHIESNVEACPRVLLHPEQIGTALVNILINAIEALENRPEPKVSLQSYFQNRQAVITISDNGIGMDDALQTKLFEPFYTAKTNGVGLGLAATLGILKAHEAEIEVKSELGVGSVFTLKFKVV